MGGKGKGGVSTAMLPPMLDTDVVITLTIPTCFHDGSITDSLQPYTTHRRSQSRSFQHNETRASSRASTRDTSVIPLEFPADFQNNSKTAVQPSPFPSQSPHPRATSPTPYPSPAHPFTTLSPTPASPTPRDPSATPRPFEDAADGDNTREPSIIMEKEVILSSSREMVQRTFDGKEVKIEPGCLASHSLCKFSPFFVIRLGSVLRLTFSSKQQRKKCVK